MFRMFVAAAGTLAAGQALALYLDAALVAIVAILGLVVLSDSARQWYGYVVQKRPLTSSEIVVMAGGGSTGNLHTTVTVDDDGFRLPHGTGCC
jgi:carbon starvation protein